MVVKGSIAGRFFTHLLRCCTYCTTLLSVVTGCVLWSRRTKDTIQDFEEGNQSTQHTCSVHCITFVQRTYIVSPSMLALHSLQDRRLCLTTRADSTSYLRLQMLCAARRYCSDFEKARPEDATSIPLR